LITCYLRWSGSLAANIGATFMPSEGANNVALALFSFPSLAAYETYRQKAAIDAECQAAMRYYQETQCFVSYERSFFRPIFR
jgi:NIPSNAP protein